MKAYMRYFFILVTAFIFFGCEPNLSALSSQKEVNSNNQLEVDGYYNPLIQAFDEAVITNDMELIYEISDAE